jgi:hypothetical protein
MVRHGEIKSEQSDDGADQSLGCRSARPKTMPIVSAVVIAGTEKWGWPPGVVRGSARHRLVRKPHGEAAPPLQCRVIRRPVRDPIPGLGDVMAVFSVVLKGTG